MVDATHRLSAELSDRGERLDRLLARRLPQLSRNRLQALLREGCVRVDSRPAKAAARVKGGEQIEVVVPAPSPVSLEPENLPIDVLYEDDDIIAVNKAAGMVVHPGAGHAKGTLVHAILHRVRNLRGVGGELRPGVVHRLDKDTSGVLVMAKHADALVALQDAFASRTVEKHYLALVAGAPPRDGNIETRFGRHPRDRKRFTGTGATGKHAHTAFSRLEQFDGCALLDVRLHTGRTHQIRVHLTEAGFPLLGDTLYGTRRKRGGDAKEAETLVGRQALHAWKLAFDHPQSSRPVELEAPLPPDFQGALDWLRRRPVKRPDGFGAIL
ncbi:MAG: RluA family pseudouridine synthase [Myxococcaceae bacterium]